MLPLIDYDTAVLGIRGLLAALLAIYVAQGCPDLIHKPEDYFSEKPSKEAWDELIKTTLDGKDYETHVYKVLTTSFRRQIEDSVLYILL